MTRSGKPDDSAPAECVRARFEAALAGRPIRTPIYAVYDWFVQNRPIDWASLFAQGLGQINHATLAVHERPNLQVSETTLTDASGNVRTDIRWETDIGELTERHLGEWRQEYLVKKPEDYRILARAFAGTKVKAAPEPFRASEQKLGDAGITLAQPVLRRTALQAVQIDFAGLERFSIDIANEEPALMELLEAMDDITCREFEIIASGPAQHVKLWENLTIETMGPALYRKYVVPTYRRIFDLLRPNGKKLCVHYDGKLRLIAGDIARLEFDGLDSLTPPPEGDMAIAEARAFWPDKFFWLHPCLGWYEQPEKELVRRVRQMVKDAGPSRFCLMISEELPYDWARTVPAILRALRTP